MKNLQKLKVKNSNCDSSPENISLFNGVINTISGTIVLAVLFYINSPEFDVHNRVKRASLDYFSGSETLEDIIPVHLISDDDFDLMHRRKKREVDDFDDFLEGEIDESFENDTAEFNDFLHQIGIEDLDSFSLIPDSDQNSHSKTISTDNSQSTEVLDENGSGLDLGMFDYDASADGSGFNDYSDEDALIFARSFSDDNNRKATTRRRGPRKNNRRRKPRERPINWNRLRPDDLEKIAPKMHEKFEKRMQEFNSLVKNISLAEEDPEKLTDPAYDDFRGYDRTAPVINKFLNALNCNNNGNGLFQQPGKTSIYVLFPGAVSLFSEPGQVVEDYGYFWKWWMKIADLLPSDRFNNVRFSVGVYSTSAAFTPKGFKPRQNMPWERLQRFYKAPRMTAIQPNLLAAAARVNTWVYSYGVSTPMVGDNCVFFWFIHNVPADLEKFHLPEHYSHWEDLRSMCNVIPILIGPSEKDPENAWGRLAAILEPGLQTHLPKDPEYSGVFRLDEHKELVSEGFLKTLFNYICLLESRTLCRFRKKGFVFDEDKKKDDNTLAEDGFRVYDEGVEPGTDYEYFGNDETPVTEAPKASKAPDVPEADVCCGHGMYSGTAYNNEERTCCANGNVKKYLETGLDACVITDDDFGVY